MTVCFYDDRFPLASRTNGQICIVVLTGGSNNGGNNGGNTSNPINILYKFSYLVAFGFDGNLP